MKHMFTLLVDLLLEVLPSF